MRKFTLFAEGYIDEESEFEYKHISQAREVFPLVHDHDYYEFILMIDGRLHHRVNGEAIQLERGHLVFIRPNDCHALESPPDGGCHYVNLAIMQKTIDDLFCYLGDGFNSKDLLEVGMPPSVLLTAGELQTLVKKLDKLNTLPVNDKKRLNTELRVILIDLLTGYLVQGQHENDLLPDWLKRTLEALQDPEHFKTGLPAAREVSCKSDEHLSRSFKRYLHKTPTQYINEQRLNFAANQIRFTTKSIADICHDSGFDNQSNFHRQFKSQFGFSPFQFRKLHLRELSINA